MKITSTFLLLFFALSTFGQQHTFVKNFVAGTITLKDSSEKAGWVKWSRHQNDKLQFRETEDGETRKYSPEEMNGFTADTFRFKSLYNFQVYAENYSLLGKMSKVKHTFGQILDSGKFNIYLVLISGYDPLAGGIQTYPNFLFQNGQIEDAELVAYPFLIRMRDKKYDRAKEDLYLLFKDHPDIISSIKNYKQRDNFFDIVDMVKAINQQ